MQPVNTEHIKEEKKIPNLRFPGFEREWEIKIFGDLTQDASYGMNSAAIEFDGINKYLRITDIDEKSRKFVPKPLTSPNGELEDKYRLKMGDIVFARTGASVGKCYLYNDFDGNLYYAGFLIKFSIKEYAEPYFIYSYTFGSNYMKWVQVMSMRSGQPGINSEEYKSLEFYVPSLPEQQKIAYFLSAVDQKIQQLTRKKELLEQYKKGVMQKIFSQEINFKQDDGSYFPNWEVIRAKDVFKNHSNKNHNGDLPILAASQKKGMVYRDSIDIQIKSSEASVKSYKVVEKGDFVISLRSFQGGIEYSYLNGICSPAYTILKPVIPIIDTFFKFYFKKEDFIERLSKTIIGIRDGKQITYENFGWLKLNIPSNAEQQKIAEFLSNIDNKIESIQTQINQSQKFKNGLLQQMFV